MLILFLLIVGILLIMIEKREGYINTPKFFWVCFEKSNRNKNQSKLKTMFKKLEPKKKGLHQVKIKGKKYYTNSIILDSNKTNLKKNTDKYKTKNQIENNDFFFEKNVICKAFPHKQYNINSLKKELKSPIGNYK